ncbi:MAG TPA: Uma2 family endonuclease [Bryobacteraceae bacterium]|nr:Uma2 family endonuclease [Bryobacteraceae bacterium]
MGASTHILTEDEALSLPVDRLEEIVNGEIRKMPLPERGHFRLIAILTRLLMKQLPEDHFEVVTTAYGLGIRREPLAVRVPDLTVFDVADLLTDYDQSGKRGYVWLAPKLVVECLSPSNRKGSVHQLLADYESAAAKEVWMVDPRHRVVERYLLREGLMELADTLKEGELQATSVPSVIDVSRLWQAFDTGR